VIVSLIWAMSDNRVIGIENRLPWKLPADMRWFRQHTLGKPIIMGRTTYQSFGSKALPDRPNIILSRNANFHADDARVVSSIEHALQACEPHQEAMIIGGANIYQQFLPMADRLYITLVHTHIDGDAHFPEFELDAWDCLEQIDHSQDNKHAYDFTFYRYQRRR